MQAKLKLYGYFRSSCSWRVRIALYLKELPFEYAPVHLLRDGGEQNTEAYRSKSPAGTVPCLEVEEGGQVRHLTQSLAILDWLDARFPSPRLVPEDPWLRAQVLERAELVNSGIQPLQNLMVLKFVKGAGGDEQAFARNFVKRGLEALETLVSKTAGKYCVGDTLTLADVCLVPQLFGARRFGVDLEPLPTLRRVEEACQALPAFQKAAPEAQPDYQA